MLSLDFTPFPILHTARLLLRELTEADGQDLFALRSDPEAMRYIPRPRAQTLADALELIANLQALRLQGEGLSWAISPRDSNELMGIAGLWRINKENYRTEVGYMLRPEFWRQGFASEALVAVVRHSFEVLRFHSLAAHVDPENRASIRVLERNGFAKEGHLRQDCYFEGRFCDTLIYGRLASDPG